MKEVKFRAWIKKANKMASWDLIKKECNRFSLLDNTDFIFMQYTGLKDKNGTEIYEGDIIGGCNGSINCSPWEWGPDVISFENAKFTVPLWGTSERCDSTHWFTVIGNIYKNPELLEGT